MGLWRQLTHGIGVLTGRTHADADIDADVRQYIDEATDAYVASGLPLDEARTRARRDMGNPTAVREQVRDYGWENTLSALMADIRFAVRMLRKTPVFTIVVVFVIAVGSGAVTTIFSAMNAVVLRPLSGVREPARLVALQPLDRQGGVGEQGSFELYTWLKERSSTLGGVAAWGRVSLTIAVDGRGAPALGNMVSANYFEVLGVRPAMGRFFSADEDATPGAHPVVVVSHVFWTTRLHASADAIGRPLQINGHPYVVIGVAPEPFAGVYTGLRPDAWIPLMMQPQLRPRSNLTTASWLWMFGRLRDGTSPQAARTELAALAAARRAERDRGGDSMGSMLATRLTGLPSGEGGVILGFMGMLMGAAALVLLIAAGNVASMLSARYVQRSRELAVRAALGAGRIRLLRQLLTEILALFLLGALGGFLVARVATAVLERLPLPGNVPLVLDLSPDLRVLAFAIGVSLLTGLVFGLAPARQAARRDVISRLRTDSAGSGSRRTIISRTMIIAQLALSLVLLVTAGLFVRALDRARQVDPGFSLDAVTAVSLEPEAWGYDEPKARLFYSSLLDRVEKMGGVTAAACTGRVPLTMGSSRQEITTGDGRTAPIDYAAVGPGYFSALQIPLMDGRPFAESDNQSAARVAVVNQTFARRLWPDGSALGRTFEFRGLRTTIVGITRDARYASLQESTPAFAYFPLAQVWQPGQTLLVWSAAPDADVAAAVQRAVLAIDPALPVPRIGTLREATAIVLLPQRVAACVTAALGALGLVVASAGLYGIMSFSASRRTREIGIRMALGAERASVVRMMVFEGLRLAAAGLGAGLVLSAVASRLMARWLFGVSPLDLHAFAGMSAVLLGVALVATWLPARRAASLDPRAALAAD